MKSEPTTFAQNLTTIFVVMPLAVMLSIYTWLRLFAWYIEPIVHFHPNWWWATGIGSITFYYQYNPHAKVEPTTRDTWFSSSAAPFIKYGICLGVGWLCHLYAVLTPS